MICFFKFEFETHLSHVTRDQVGLVGEGVQSILIFLFRVQDRTRGLITGGYGAGRLPLPLPPPASSSL